jgi:hypothetical protein
VVIEEPRHDRLRRARLAGAATAALASTAAAAAIWGYGLTAAPDVGGAVFLLTGAHLAGTHWRRRRQRRADLDWHAALVLPGGVCPGLLARWSRRATIIDVAVPAGLVAAGLMWGGERLATGHMWSGAIMSALAGAGALFAAMSLFRRLRHSGGVAITSYGVAADGDLVPWDQIVSVALHDEGVRLRRRGNMRLDVGGPNCAVPDERLREVIAFFHAQPHRRSAIGSRITGLSAMVR